MKSLTKRETKSRRGLNAVVDVSLVAVLLFAALGSATAYAVADSAPDVVISHTMMMTADANAGPHIAPVPVASTDAADQTLNAVVSHEPPAPDAASGNGPVGAVTSAGGLLIVGLLGLAGLNSRKRPLRLARPTIDRDR